MARWRAVVGPALAGLLLSACATGGSSPGGSAPATAEASRAPVLSLADLDAAPAPHRDESVALAFDRAAAEALLEEVPDDLDLDAQAVVCVFLGPRQTSGWSLDLRTATLTGNQLDIAARENAPRGTTRPEVTYPADCGLLSRAALRAGELVVRADDTITGEFIAETTVVVPEASNVP
jgi:hypothetical protein